MKRKYYLLAFIIPFVCTILLMGLQGFYPFGEETSLTIDLSNQYLYFFAYCKEIAMNLGDVFYSFSKTLGGEMIGLVAYYLMSPLNIVYVLAPTEQLPNAIMVVTLIKVGLAGLSFYIYLRKADAKYLALSTGYALMAYGIVFMSNTMWMDSVILLPLVILGIEYIVENKKPWLYLGTLAAAILLNYYIGYMICLFSVIYFCYYFFFVIKPQNDKGKIVARYGIASVLAGGISAWILLPVLSSLNGVKSSAALSELSLKSDFAFRELISKYIIGATSQSEIRDGLPNIYCGIIILIFVAFFFVSTKYSIRHKIGAALVLLVMIFSFKLHGLNLIWHGLTPPVWFFYRNSFLFSFFLLVLAGKGMDSYQEEPRKKLVVTLAVGSILYALAILWSSKLGADYITPMKMILSVGIMICTALFILGAYKKERLVSIGILSLLVIELLLNGWYSMSIFNYQKLDNVQAFIRETGPAVDYVKEQDQTFYRMEKTFLRREDDPMMFGYKGTSHYSSSEKGQVRVFMGRLGFRNNGNWSYYNTGTTYANDSLLGIKYLLTKDTLKTGYRLMETIGDVNIYENIYTLPIGFMVDDDIVGAQFGGDDWYDTQNSLWENMSSTQQENIFEREENVSVRTKNVSEIVAEDGSIDYEKQKKGAYIEYTFTAKDENPLFIYFKSEDPNTVKVKVNGKSYGDYFTAKNHQILRINQFEQGEKIKIRLTLKGNYVNIKDVMFFYQDMAVFEKYYQELESQGFVVENFSSTKLTGTLKSDDSKRYCMLTIPFEEGWKIKINGKDTEKLQILDALMVFEVPKGEHQIELVYTPPKLKEGIVITSLALLSVVLWVLYEKWLGNKNKE